MVLVLGIIYSNIDRRTDRMVFPDGIPESKVGRKSVYADSVSINSDATDRGLCLVLVPSS